MKALGLMTMAIMGVAALLAGCASTSGARSEPTTSAARAPAHEPGRGMMGDMCPMQVPGTTVTSADVEGGVALVFTTRTGDAAELRQRVRRMAEMHNHHHAGGGTMREARAPAPPGPSRSTGPALRLAARRATAGT